MRITIIGLGWTGSSITYSCLLHPQIFCNLDLIDIDEKKLKGELADLEQAEEVLNKGIIIEATSEPRKSEIYIFCAGKSLEKGIDRDELYRDNLPILIDYTEKIKKVRMENSMALVVTNPSTLLAQSMMSQMPFVIPIGNKIDNARLRLCKVNCSHEKPDIQMKYIEAKEGKGYTNWAVSSEVINYILGYIYGFGSITNL